MKKELLLISVLVISAFSLFAAGALPKKPVKVRIAFDIAAPRFDCDEGLGICKASIGVGRIGGDGRSAAGECYYEDDVLYVYIFRDRITPDLDRELSASEAWVQPADQEVPQVWLDAMEVNGSYRIPAGNYEKSKEKEFFLVRFILR